MGYHGFDLVYELQVELGWEKEFATAARKEYLRYLQLRAKAQDYQACKLTPSRVIAIVWNLHRQWTTDYENTCAALGGYIHHYPPAMRLGLTSEQAYANTVEMYKGHFNEDPPDAYWGVPICSNKPSSSNIDYLSSLSVAENVDAQAHSATKTKKRTPTAGSTRGAAPDVAQLGDVSNPPASTSLGHVKSDSKPQKSKRVPGTSRVRHGYVLRPLPPGEKRKRGRPSMSEYIPVAQATSQLQEYVGNVAIGDAEIKPVVSVAVSVPGRGSAAMLKSRRQQGKPPGAHDINGQTAGDTPGAPVVFKRPRGRPRKDGSWPIVRHRPDPALKQKIEPITSAEAQMPTVSEAKPAGAHLLGLPDSALHQPQENPGAETGKDEESTGKVATGLEEHDIMDIGEHVQKPTAA
ncbi:unnamed protein product [Agarophyton chilense]|eukprot:gb/GEZJ01003877.1/.p1 GENE.gb/GEZJ01003877.1/~~gb/GEZJ01003877.1/.p1  ORF type:complete len:406 (+),score=52.88 gb/GEZJ01003877.1/:290-1507(+)